MLNINMEDVVGVINACKPQLIVLAVVLVLAAAVIIAMAVNKKVKKADRFFIRWNAVLAFVLAVAVIANWVCTGGTLTVTFTDDATEAAIAKCLHERDFAGLDFDKVYLVGGSAPDFFPELQVAEKPADSEVVYTTDWHKADGTTITMVDAPTRIRISKLDITTGEEVPGAELQIVDSDGNVVESWTSGTGPHYIEGKLVAGATYTLVETLAPTAEGYVPARSIRFTVEDDGKVQQVFMQDDYTKVSISKTDIATGAEVPGAHLQIVDGEGNVLAEWVTDGTPHYIERLPVGTLTLIETQAPTEDGYVRAENVTFEVLPTGEIQRVEMKDDFTKVEISKKDITNGDELRGAHLQITDSEGHIVAEWITDGRPHRIDRLQPGEYILTETTPPERLPVGRKRALCGRGKRPHPEGDDVRRPCGHLHDRQTG